MPSRSTDGSAADILTSLRTSLLSLHKTLLDSERALYERDVAPVQSPGQMLSLLMGDPWFAYLRELSQFVVAIDELLDSKENPATMAEAAAIVSRARQLLRPSESGSVFERRYFEALQRDPDVVIAHGRVSRLISSFRKV